MEIQDPDDVFFDVDEDLTMEATDNQQRNTPLASASGTVLSPIISDSNITSFDNDRLEKYGRWLLSIPRDDIIALRQTPEYHDFLQAFDRLGQTHRRVIAVNRNLMDLQVLDDSDSSSSSSPFRKRLASSAFSFLQHLAVDDVILRVFEFLECHSLIRTSVTCSRFRELAHRSATQRTHDVARARQLSHVMKLLRAKEQIDGVGNGLYDRHVRVPMLGLSRRVLVTDSGDPEYNGVYFCTGSNGNGFVFTKPRHPEQRVAVGRSLLTRRIVSPSIVVPDGDGVPQPQPPVVTVGIHRDGTVLHNEDNPRPGQLLRCIIAKRFSNETILWYMSKEVESITISIGTRFVPETRQVSQMFSFWSKLMVIGDASPDVCRYPSQSSILTRGGEPGWQQLSSTRSIEPPTVELLD